MGKDGLGGSSGGYEKEIVYRYREKDMSFAHNKKLRIAFDMDGTLIHQVGEKEDTPRYEIVAMFQTLSKLGCDMYIWSGSGEDWAERWRDKLGLTATIVPKGSFTPDICFDDGNAEPVFTVDLADKNIQV